MNQKMKTISIAVLATASLLCANAHATRNAGGVDDAEGAYAVLFPLAQAVPKPRLTPGVLNPDVTQATIHSTICVKGYTRTIRPEEGYTRRLKREQIAAYGYTDRRLRDYEEDHLVSLELGGSPTDPRNLWPQPHHVVGGWGSYAKDRLENKLKSLVCKGRLPLADAQSAIASDWIGAYKRFVGPAADDTRERRYGD
ncbi:hypothetical protein B0G57_10389 [Trinickia symbiotica]|uniref:hypothetical protein n=1 Tax=Trinickia symbiotica TaxID=863227 RepID=UPI000D474356|nr:hypothetical protein [Trinickia symbiotica]PPK46065.1 hypothetical protein B0G57_10389 [Trinickia symbiotica]